MKHKKTLLVMSVLISLFIFSFCTKAAGVQPFEASEGSVAGVGWEESPLPENAVIVLPQDATEQEIYAASVLKEYIDQLNATPLPVVKEGEADNGVYQIRVGNTAAFTADLSGLDDGGYVIKSIDNGVIIQGVGNRGTIYGVYRFLEEFGGYHCFTASMGLTTDWAAFDVPDNIDIRRNVFFEYTDTDWLSPRDVTYSLANGLNGTPYRTIPQEMGGTVGYISNFCHTLTTQFCAADTYFDTHPEYFALHEGKRNKNQLCLTNENVIRIVTDEVLALIREKHDPQAAVQIVSLTQNDNYDYCECEKCKALDDENGSHAGTMITFVNDVAQAVKQAGYDNIAIDTFAYQYTRKAPTAVEPLDNVIVRLCTIECCFSHPLNDESCPENVELKRDLENWSKICSRIYVWDYTTNYAETVGLFPDFGVIQANLQFFYEHGVKGVYEEGNYYMAFCDAEFGELRSYLLSRFMQDPYADFDREINAFLAAYYGEGWQNIRSFLNLITQKAAEKHLKIYASMKDSLELTKEETERCDLFWDNAKAVFTDADKENNAQYQNICRSELSWRYWKLSQSVWDIKAISQRKALYNDLISFGVNMLHEGDEDNMDLGSVYMFSKADEWSERESGLISVLLNGASIILYTVSLIFALFNLIRGVKLKKYIFCVPLVLYAAGAALVMWNKRSYLAWKDIDEYVFTVVFLCLLFAFFFVLYGAVGKKTTAKSLLMYGLAGVGAFLVPYEACLVIINNVINKGLANGLAYDFACLAISAVLMLITVFTDKKLKMNHSRE